MYTGQVVIKDTVHVNGQVTGDFMIGLPAKYSAYVLKVIAYDTNNVYQVNIGVQLGDKTGFYGVQVDFGGHTPSVFTVAFVLSSNLITYESGTSVYTLDFPAYPSLTQDVPTCNVTVTLPSAPTSITITKSDGTVSGDNYVTQNLPAYTYSVGSAAFKIQSGTLQIADITQLNRQVNIDPTGKVASSDTYYITANSSSTMTAFVLNLPTTASNVVVRDQFGRILTTTTSTLSSQDILVVNVTLVTFLTSGESTSITADYHLPSATVQGSQYTLSDFKLFPNFYYYVDQATFTFNPPEGATIISPTLSSLDPSITITRSSFQDTLTITRDGISFLDYNAPQGNTINLSYNYSPVWVSFRPTFWTAFLAAIVSVGVVFYRRSKPSGKEPAITRAERATTEKPTSTAASQQAKPAEQVISPRITPESVKEFTDAYEEKKQLSIELKSLDSRAQKGKIPRRQYKVQRRAIEIRLETLTRNTSKLKEAFRSSTGAYSDLARQLDSAEEELAEVEENIRTLELRQNRGEISIETYKKNIADYQKRRDKAESTLNGILLRLREKTR